MTRASVQTMGTFPHLLVLQTRVFRAELAAKGCSPAFPGLLMTVGEMRVKPQNSVGHSQPSERDRSRKQPVRTLTRSGTLVPLAPLRAKHKRAVDSKETC